MSIKLNSSGGGSITLQESATASNVTLNIPAVNGNVITSGDTASVTPAMMSQKLTLDTAKNSTSGTNIDFVGIPSWATRVTVMLSGVSSSGTDVIQLQLGAGTIQASNYNSITNAISSTVNSTTLTTGFGVQTTSSAFANASLYGAFVLTKLTGNTWVCVGSISDTTNTTGFRQSGSVVLSSTLDRVRLTTTNTFDAGTVNILYEG